MHSETFRFGLLDDGNTASPLMLYISSNSFQKQTQAASFPKFVGSNDTGTAADRPPFGRPSLGRIAVGRGERYLGGHIRGIFATNARAWDTLTEAQRLAWNAAAATHQTRTRCGTNGPMTGLQFYQQINANLALLGQETVDAPPAPPVFDALAPVNLVITVAAGAAVLKLTCPTAPGANTVLCATPPQKQGVSKCTNWRTLGTCPAPAQGSADITALYTATFGAPPIGSKVFVRAHLMVNGFQSVPAIFNGIVPAA